METKNVKLLLETIRDFLNFDFLYNIVYCASTVSHRGGLMVGPACCGACEFLL